MEKKKEVVKRMSMKSKSGIRLVVGIEVGKARGKQGLEVWRFGAGWQLSSLS